jgi:hypothetical protein
MENIIIKKGSELKVGDLVYVDIYDGSLLTKVTAIENNKISGKRRIIAEVDDFNYTLKLPIDQNYSCKI